MSGFGVHHNAIDTRAFVSSALIVVPYTHSGALRKTATRLLDEVAKISDILDTWSRWLQSCTVLEANTMGFFIDCR